MSNESNYALAYALASVIFTSILGLVHGVEKKAFMVDSTDAAFGDLCPIKGSSTGTWVRDVDNAVVVICSGARPTAPPCRVTPSALNDFQRVVKNGANSLSLQPIPKVETRHAGTYTCNTDPYEIRGSNQEFKYDVTVYDKLRCADNVTQHKAGETIELTCSIDATGNGVPDLEFQVLDKDSTVESYSSSKDGATISMLLKLEKKHHGKQLACIFKGFDGVVKPSEEKPPECIVNNETLNVLYKPEFTSGFNGARFAIANDEENLNCVANANPSAVVKYFVNGDKEVAGAFVPLTADTRSISCSATNEIGTITSTKIVNFVSFNLDGLSSIIEDMKKGVRYDLNCNLQQSNLQQTLPVKVKQMIGDDELESTSVEAKKEWNGKKVDCIASDGDGKEILRDASANTITVFYDAEITCLDQVATEDAFQRHCTISQNPLAKAESITASTNAKFEMGERDTYNQNLTLIVAKATLSEKKKLSVTITVSGDPDSTEKTFEFIYEEPRTTLGLIVGLVAGVVILTILIVLLVIFIKRGALCTGRKKGLTDSEKGDSQFPSDDGGHGQPPANRSMNGYDNKVAPNDDGLVYADLAFSDHQPRSRAPIIDPYSTTDYADIDFRPPPPPYSISDSIG